MDRPCQQQNTANIDTCTEMLKLQLKLTFQVGTALLDVLDVSYGVNELKCMPTDHYP